MNVTSKIINICFFGSGVACGNSLSSVSDETGTSSNISKTDDPIEIEDKLLEKTIFIQK
jgi:hypothetical protein